MPRILLFAIALSVGAAACSDKAPPADPDAGIRDVGAVEDAGESGDGAGQGDAGDSSDGGADVDASENGCVQVSVAEAFSLPYADDVSVEYETALSPTIEDSERALSLLFERYNDTSYEGTFELGTGADANFGTCAHCVFIRSDVRERAFFADRGTLVSRTNPYSRRLDIEVSNLRLVEVEVEPETRASTPVEDGLCIEVADFAHEGVYPPQSWSCTDDAYGNGVACDCECGAWDPDCGDGTEHCVLGDPACQPREPLPVAGCEEEQVCAFDPNLFTTRCMTPCDWLGREGCASGTCVFDFGVGDGDLCINDNQRVASGVSLGETCPNTGFQVVCNVVDGFAEGICGPNNICRPVCQSDEECEAPEETCRMFTIDGPLGYCGPEPTDG